MLAEQDNCGTDLHNKTKVGLHSKEGVPGLSLGPWKWNPVLKKKKKNGGGVFAEQDNFNTN